MSILVVTGTSTGVGKTVVTAAVAALAADAGRRVAVVKPAQTGVGPGHSESESEADVDTVRRLLGPLAATTPTGAARTARAGAADGRPAGSVSLSTLATYPDPLAPATAARRSGQAPLRLEAAVLAVREQAVDHELVVVEGAGGLLVRFADDPPWTLLDLVVALNASVVVVAHAGLGTLNHTALTAEALRSRGVDPVGVVVGAWPSAPDLAARCNLSDLTAAGAGPLLGALPHGMATTGDVDTFLGIARAGLAPVLGGTLDAADFIRTHAPEHPS